MSKNPKIKRSRPLPKFLAEIDPFDPDTYIEGIRGAFWSTYEIVPDPEGIETPTVEEIVRYDPHFAFAVRELDVHIHRNWVREKRRPEGPLSLVYRYHNHWYDGPGEREDYIAIPRGQLAKFRRKVAFVLDALDARKRGRKSRR